VRAPHTPRRVQARRPQVRRPAGSRGSVVVGISYVDPDRITALYARYGAVVQATDGGIQAQAVADAINAAGGIGGRKLVLRLFKDDPTDSRPLDAHLQAGCSFFADGARPAAVINTSDRALTAPCLASKGLTLITNGPTTASSAAFSRYPDTLFAPGSLAMDRFAAPYVQALQGAGFFGNGARVGIVHWSDPEFDVATSALRDELGRAGVKIVADGNVPFVRSAADAGAAVSRVASVIVRFRLAGVNRVVSVDQSGSLMTIFMLAAEPQGYRPLYGLSTLNAPMSLLASVNPRQLRGAVGIGWMPLVDVPAGPDDDIPPVRAQCAAIYRRAGIAVGDRSPYGQFSAYSFCDSLMILRRVLAHGRSTSQASMRAGLESLGGGYTSALDFASRLDASRHDGAAGYRLLRFDSGCTCFRYDGPVQQIG
jgi:ABC-type branched-subunit amino acid transport system substrate-binding protein